jgi:hypothetical protein
MKHIADLCAYIGAVIVSLLLVYCIHTQEQHRAARCENIGGVFVRGDCKWPPK